MERITAKIQCTVGEFSVRRSLPNGKHLEISWNKGNNFIAEVPVTIVYADDFGKKHSTEGNYAQELLRGYDFLKLVETIEAPAVVQPERKPKTRSKKEDTDENAS